MAGGDFCSYKIVHGMNETSGFYAKSHPLVWHTEAFKHFGKERLKYAFANTLLRLVMSFHFLLLKITLLSLSYHYNCWRQYFWEKILAILKLRSLTQNIKLREAKPLLKTKSNLIFLTDILVGMHCPKVFICLSKPDKAASLYVCFICF